MPHLCVHHVIADHAAEGFPEVQRAMDWDKSCSKEVERHCCAMGPMFSTKSRVCLAEWPAHSGNPVLWGRFCTVVL